MSGGVEVETTISIAEIEQKQVSIVSYVLYVEVSTMCTYVKIRSVPYVHTIHCTRTNLRKQTKSRNVVAFSRLAFLPVAAPCSFGHASTYRI